MQENAGPSNLNQSEIQSSMFGLFGGALSRANGPAAQNKNSSIFLKEELFKYRDASSAAAPPAGGPAAVGRRSTLRSLI